MGTDRYSRNVGLFGEEGQLSITSTKVAVVGLGGLGSHVTQQLAYLGTNQFALIDFDHVTDSSLNRLVGANDADVAVATKKIRVAERLIIAVNPSALVKTYDAHVSDAVVEPVIRDADVVFGCLDRDLPRLELIDLCARSRRPLFDLASDVEDDAGMLRYGGRMILCDGTRCLSCLGLLDQREMARDSMSPAQREAHDRIYGVPRSHLDGTGPMVISVNGAVASMAVTEFMVWRAGLRDPFPHLKYFAHTQTIRKNADAPEPDCYYCKARWASAIRPTDG